MTESAACTGDDDPVPDVRFRVFDGAIDGDALEG